MNMQQSQVITQMPPNIFEQKDRETFKSIKSFTSVKSKNRIQFDPINLKGENKAGETTGTFNSFTGLAKRLKFKQSNFKTLQF